MATGITLDKDIQDNLDFRYQTLVKTFGKEEADKIVGSESDDKLDDDLQEIIDGAGTLEDYK